MPALFREAHVILPNEVEDIFHEKIAQTYDSRGNVVGITDTYNSGVSDSYSGEYTTTYEYDDVNRLIKEINGACGFTREYAYTNEGNLASVTENGEKEEYEYSAGRLTHVKKNGINIENYTYDNFGNPTHFKSGTQNMWWERGTFLKQYGNITYTYDARGRLHGKSVNLEGGEEDRTHRLYYDGDKLIAMEIGNKILRFFYDPEGVAGFKIGIGERYTYTKDCQGNVIGLVDEEQQTVRYVYDAWGNSIALDKDGEEITAWDDPAMLNPIRWKSQYYDTDSKLYWIGQRWYDPERGRYISAASPEMLLQNASVIFALNLYAFVTSNPVAVLLACGSIYPSLDFYYNGEYKTWWEQYGNWILFGIGVVAVIATCIICAPCGVAFVGATLAKIALGTAVNTVIGLAIGGTIAGIQAALTGHGFWDAFGDYVTENFVDELVMNFAFTSVAAAVGNLLGPKHCFAAGTLVATRAGLKPIEDIEVGDEVLAYDEVTGEQAYKPVVQLFRNETKEWYHVRVNDEEIICTGGHPFYVLNAEASRKSVLYEGTKTDKKGKWITAKELKVSDQVLLSDGSCAIIEEIQVERLSAPETTYNFEVANYHTYYVSDSKVLVHNRCKSPYDYLDEALEKNGYTRKDIPDLVKNSPNGQWKYTWKDGGTIYEVRIHAGNPQFTNSKYIFRVARQTYGRGWQYLGLDNRWYKASALKQFHKGGIPNPNFDEFGSIMTHLSI